MPTRRITRDSKRNPLMSDAEFAVGGSSWPFEVDVENVCGLIVRRRTERSAEYLTVGTMSGVDYRAARSLNFVCVLPDVIVEFADPNHQTFGRERPEAEVVSRFAVSIRRFE